MKLFFLSPSRPKTTSGPLWGPRTLRSRGAWGEVLLRCIGMGVATCWLLGCAGPPSGGHAQSAEVHNDPDCLDVRSMTAAQLYGSWNLELPQLGQRGQLTLRQHPEFSQSLRGEFRYGGHTSIASGDVEAGEFNLDESRDGKSLFGFWSGRLTAAQCGDEIRGVWQTLPQDGQPGEETEFVLRRAPH